MEMWAHRPALARGGSSPKYRRCRPRPRPPPTGPAPTRPVDVSITEAPVRGGVGNPRGLTVSVDPGHAGPRVSPDPGPTPGTADGE